MAVKNKVELLNKTMPQLIKPNKTTVITNTSQGECQVQITLDLNINLNSDGIALSVGAKSDQNERLEQQKKDETDVAWEIGDFAPKKKIKFGKSVED